MITKEFQLQLEFKEGSELEDLAERFYNFHDLALIIASGYIKNSKLSQIYEE